MRQSNICDKGVGHMTINELKAKLNNGEYNEQLKYIYACEKTDSYKNRFEEVIDGFVNTFEYSPDDMRLFSAPGRTEGSPST